MRKAWAYMANLGRMGAHCADLFFLPEMPACTAPARLPLCIVFIALAGFARLGNKNTHKDKQTTPRRQAFRAKKTARAKSPHTAKTAIYAHADAQEARTPSRIYIYDRASSAEIFPKNLAYSRKNPHICPEVQQITLTSP